jgi:hypothetical protein
MASSEKAAAMTAAPVYQALQSPAAACSSPRPRDPPLDPDFGITFVLATANDVRKFVMANTEPRKYDQTREGAR